jgi:CMP-N,N'-diacetyllegionaminic acid synthase
MNQISNGLSICAIILARGGSKGLPGKNIIDLAGLPLIAYTIQAAKKSKYVNRIIVSSDDAEIMKVSNIFGAETPFKRPADLSDDYATSEASLKHCLVWMNKEENYFPDIVVYLQPTDIFRTPTMIDDCVKALIDDEHLDSAFMGHVTHKNYWQKINDSYMRLGTEINFQSPRQLKAPIYREDTGIALATRPRIILEGNRIGKNIKIIPYEIDVNFVDIHSQFDIDLSEILIKKLKKIPNYEV